LVKPFSTLSGLLISPAQMINNGPRADIPPIARGYAWSRPMSARQLGSRVIAAAKMKALQRQ
jgi:hypothetical protein